MVSTSTFMFVQITSFSPEATFFRFHFHFHSQSTFPLPLLQPAQLLLFFHMIVLPLHCFHVYQRAVCVSIFVKQCHICHGISCCHLVFHVFAATLTCPRTVRYWQPCRFPVKHTDASLLFTLLTVANKSRKNASCPCCVAGYPVIFSCSFE